MMYQTWGTEGETLSQSQNLCEHKGNDLSIQEEQIFEPCSIRKCEGEVKNIRKYRSLLKYSYIYRNSETKSRTILSLMDKPTRAYVPLPDDPLHPTLNVPMHEVLSAVARQHAQQVFDRTNFFYQPPVLLQLKATHVLLATNNRVHEETVAPFNWTELISANVELDFFIEGKRHTVTDDAYIQFTYFSGNRDGCDFVNSLNAHPPFPPHNPNKDFNAADAIDASVITTENSAPHIDELQILSPPENLIAEDNNINNRPTFFLPPPSSSPRENDEEPCLQGEQASPDAQVLFAAIVDPVPASNNFPLSPF